MHRAVVGPGCTLSVEAMMSLPCFFTGSHWKNPQVPMAPGPRAHDQPEWPSDLWRSRRHEYLAGASPGDCTFIISNQTVSQADVRNFYFLINHTTKSAWRLLSKNRYKGKRWKFILHVWVSILITVHYRKELLWCRLRGEQVYGYKDNSGDSLLLCPFGQITVFSNGLWPTRDVVSSMSARNEFFLMELPLNTIRRWMVT